VEPPEVIFEEKVSVTAAADGELPSPYFAEAHPGLKAADGAGYFDSVFI
jgi:hypothetical protein